jgi:homeobox protein HoxA/B2
LRNDNSLSFNPHIDSNSKKSCQGCELPSDDVPDSTSNSRGQNNNTPSATNNNQSNPNERTNGSMSRGTPNSTIEMAGSGIANAVLTTSISNADSSVASTNSLEEEEESPVKIKKKEEGHSKKVRMISFVFSDV